MKFVFKKKYADENEELASYTLRFLDMKFVIYRRKGQTYSTKWFYGFRTSSKEDYIKLHNFYPPSDYSFTRLSEEQILNAYMKHIVGYIQSYYNFDTAEIIIVDEFLDMIDNWLES